MPPCARRWTALDVSVIRVGVLDLIVHARRKAVERTGACSRAELDLGCLLPGQRRVVVPHMKRVGVLKSGRRLGLPRLQVFERGFEIASFGIIKWAEGLAQAHGFAQAIGHQPDCRLVRRRKRGVDVEPDVGITWHRAIEKSLRRQLEVVQRTRADWRRRWNRRLGSSTGHSVLGRKLYGRNSRSIVALFHRDTLAIFVRMNTGSGSTGREKSMKSREVPSKRPAIGAAVPSGGHIDVGLLLSACGRSPRCRPPTS